jgi:hypothetical protein
MGNILFHITVGHIKKLQKYHVYNTLGPIIIPTKVSTVRQKVTSQSEKEIQRE